MINFLQTNQGFMNHPVATKARINKKNMYIVQLLPHMIHILNDTVWETLVDKMRSHSSISDSHPVSLDPHAKGLRQALVGGERMDVNLTPFIEYMYSITLKYNIDIKAAVKQFLRWLIFSEKKGANSAWLFAIEKAMHVNVSYDIYLRYILTHCVNRIQADEKIDST